MWWTDNIAGSYLALFVLTGIVSAWIELRYRWRRGARYRAHRRAMRSIGGEVRWRG